MRSRSLTLLSIFILGSVAVPFNGNLHQRLHHRNAAPQYGATAAPASAAPAYTTPAAAGSAAPSSPSQAPSAGGDNFEISIQNNCASDLSFGIFSISSSFAMSAIGGAVPIAAGSSGSISAPFSLVGGRLSATADQGTAAQWNAQALFEFGYSSYGGMTGTAYDLSVMGGSTGVAVYPSNPACPSKVCSPGNCAADQGWTNPDQVNSGSPADTVCYQGKTNFKVVWCP